MTIDDGGHPGDIRSSMDPAHLDRLVERLDDLARRLLLLATDLADGHAALAWRGRSRDRFEDHLAAHLHRLEVSARRLAATRVELEQLQDLP